MNILTITLFCHSHPRFQSYPVQCRIQLWPASRCCSAWGWSQSPSGRQTGCAERHSYRSSCCHWRHAPTCLQSRRLHCRRGATRGGKWERAPSATVDLMCPSILQSQYGCVFLFVLTYFHLADRLFLSLPHLLMFLPHVSIWITVFLMLSSIPCSKSVFFNHLSHKVNVTLSQLDPTVSLAQTMLINSELLPWPIHSAALTFCYTDSASTHITYYKYWLWFLDSWYLLIPICKYKICMPLCMQLIWIIVRLIWRQVCCGTDSAACRDQMTVTDIRGTYSYNDTDEEPVFNVDQSHLADTWSA